MRIVFMGTPHSAVPSLQRCLEDGHEVVAVWTQSDKPAGRGHRLGHSEVKEFALKHGLPLEQPDRIRNDEAKARFASYKADFAVVVAYGKILPHEFLTAPKRGCLNIHFSLLPHYRGAAPVNWALINGEEKTGVTTMFIEEELDSGPILLQRETPILSGDTAPDLMSRLAPIGAELLSETLRRIDEITPLSQNESEASYAPVLKKENGLIDWRMDAASIERRVRGLQPWPNAYTHFRGQHLIVWRAEPLSGGQGTSPGTVLEANKGHLVVECGQKSSLRVLEVQAQAKRRMSARDFLNGTHLQVGEIFA
jgi:methionyl-tRNA formyltransferase